MLGLVPTEDTSGLDLGSRSSGQLLVEVDNALHRDGIGVGADRLFFHQPPNSESDCRLILSHIAVLAQPAFSEARHPLATPRSGIIETESVSYNVP